MKKLPKKTKILILSIIGILIFFGVKHTKSEEPQFLPVLPVSENKERDLCGLDVVVCEGEEEVIEREVSAYTPSEDETDDTPCIAASGINVCEALKKGEKIVATNELPLYSKVKINGEVYTVLDRMNKRYTDRYDILLPTKEMAFEWGVKKIKIIKF